MKTLHDALYLTLEMTMFIPLAFYCFIPVMSHIKESPKRLILKVICACAAAEFLFFLLFLLSPTITASNTGQLILGVSMFFLYKREVRLPPFRLLFVFLTACLIGAYSYLIYHITDIILYPDGSYYTIYKPYSFLAQIIFECLLIAVIFVPTRKCIGWLVENYQEERIWRIVWIFPALLTLFSYFMVPYNNSYMYLGRFMEMYLLLNAVALVIFFTLYVLFYQIARAMTEKSNLLTRSACLEIQVQQFRELQNHLEETRRLRHDFRHHLTAISEMLEHGQYGEALHFLQEYRTEVSDLPKQYCQSTAVNAVLHHYESLFRSEGITPQFHVHVPDISEVSDIDFCVLIGNLLENALHGCRQVTDRSREIELQIIQNTPHIIILQIRNPHTGKIRKENNRFLSTKHPDPGQGLRSVQMIAEKYQGEMRITDRDRLFTVQVLLNI